MHFLAIIHFGWKLGLAYVKLDMGHFNNCIRHRYVYKDSVLPTIHFLNSNINILRI